MQCRDHQTNLFSQSKKKVVVLDGAQHKKGMVGAGPHLLVKKLTLFVFASIRSRRPSKNYVFSAQSQEFWRDIGKKPSILESIIITTQEILSKKI